MSFNKNNLWKICAAGAVVPFSAFMINWKVQVSLSREPYYQKMELLIKDYSPLHKRLGPPVKVGWVCRGFQSKTEVRDNSVKLEIPVRGKKDKAVVIGEAVKDDGRWRVTRMMVTLSRAKKSWMFYKDQESDGDEADKAETVSTQV